MDNDPDLNPFGKGQSKSGSKSGSSTTQTSQPLDPAKNYEGQGCRFFTHPPDEAHANTYADGASVVYGERVYQCEYGRWKVLYPASVLSDKDRRDRDAATREHSAISTKIFEDEE
jgi:hypothetical protein